MKPSEIARSVVRRVDAESRLDVVVVAFGCTDSSVRQDSLPCGIVMDVVGLLPSAHHLDAPSYPAEHSPRW